jgi:hypothetical protein
MDEEADARDDQHPNQRERIEQQAEVETLEPREQMLMRAELRLRRFPALRRSA